MSAPRTAGKRGRLPARRLALRYLHEYASAPLPTPTYPVDVRGGIPNDQWGMLGNGPDPTCTVAPDGVGDCTFAGRQHYRAAKAARYGQTETWETSDQLVKEYLKYDHGQDEGAVIADLLLYWYQAGAILGFAPVDHTDPAAVDSAMAAFRGCYVGVNLTDDADDLFSAGQPWTVTNGEQPDPSEGHCVVKVYADGNSASDPMDGYVTWGAFQRATPQWSASCLTEAWVIVTSEDEAARLDMAALRADIEALGGTGGSPVPAPAPKPHRRDLLDDVAALVHEVAADARRDITEVVALLRAHGL